MNYEAICNISDEVILRVVELRDNNIDSWSRSPLNTCTSWLLNKVMSIFLWFSTHVLLL